MHHGQRQRGVASASAVWCCESTGLRPVLFPFRFAPSRCRSTRGSDEVVKSALRFTRGLPHDPTTHIASLLNSALLRSSLSAPRPSVPPQQARPSKKPRSEPRPISSLDSGTCLVLSCLDNLITWIYNFKQEIKSNQHWAL